MKNKLIPLIRSGETNEATKLIDQLNIDELKIKDEHGLTAMHWIANRGDISLLNLLLAKVPNLTNIVSNNEGHTVLHAAAFGEAKVSNRDVAAILIKSNPDLIYMMDNKQKTPLHAAAYANNLGIIELLLDYGAILDFPDYTKSPIFGAFMGGQSAACYYFLSIGAAINNEFRYTFDLLDSKGIFKVAGIADDVLAGKTVLDSLHHLLERNKDLKQIDLEQMFINRLNNNFSKLINKIEEDNFATSLLKATKMDKVSFQTYERTDLIDNLINKISNPAVKSLLNKYFIQKDFSEQNANNIYHVDIMNNQHQETSNKETNPKQDISLTETLDMIMNNQHQETFNKETNPKQNIWVTETSEEFSKGKIEGRLEGEIDKVKTLIKLGIENQQIIENLHFLNSENIIGALNENIILMILIIKYVKI